MYFLNVYDIMYVESRYKMSKLRGFFNKPRNLYYCGIALLTIVTGLVSISFSYYIDETGNGSFLSLSVVDNQIQSDNLINNTLTVGGNESVTFNLYVVSNNNFESIYKLFYKANKVNLKVVADKVYSSINSHDVQMITITVENYTSVDQKVEFGIVNGYKDTELKIEGTEIKEN